MTFICRPASADIWYIQSIKKKTSEKNFDVNTRVPRRARWDFRCVLDDSLFLYLEFDLSKYLKNWLNYEVLRMKLGDLLLLLLLFIYWRFMGSCTTLQWFYTQICFFSCIDRFIHTAASLFWCNFVYIYIFYLFVVCRIYYFFWGALLRLLFCLLQHYYSLCLVFSFIPPHRRKILWSSAYP